MPLSRYYVHQQIRQRFDFSSNYFLRSNKRSIVRDEIRCHVECFPREGGRADGIERRELRHACDVGTIGRSVRVCVAYATACGHVIARALFCRSVACLTVAAERSGENRRNNRWNNRQKNRGGENCEKNDAVAAAQRTAHMQIRHREFRRAQKPCSADPSD